MTGSLTWITDEMWPSDEGWPYPDDDAGIDLLDDAADPEGEVDDDLVSLHAAAPRLFHCLSELERRVVVARLGLDGSTPRSMRELRDELHVPLAEVRDALAGAMVKLRAGLAPAV